MKALLLAAGFGSRLAPITNDLPKSLVPVNGKPIILKQIENLEENGVYDITVVSGYMADKLEKAIYDKHPNVKIVESANYAITNNMYSAYLGIKDMFRDGIFSPFYMMNADVFFDSSIIAALEKDKRYNLIVTDYDRYMEESMKVKEKDGRIIAISKQITPEEALGCSIDVYKFGKDGARAFYKKCVEYIDVRKEIKKWSEVALNDALAEVIFQACPVNGRWLEIDDHSDLKAAEILFA